MARAILFDVDGTLVDTNDLHATAWREAFLRFGIDIPLDRVRGQIGKGGDNLIPSLLPDLAEEERQRIESFRSDLFKRDYLPRATPFAGVRPLFERLFADGAGIVLASSSGEEEVGFYVGLLGVEDLLTATTSKDDAAHSKPDPDIFAAALEKVAPLEAADALVIGDSPYDMEAAAKLGIPAVGVRCGGFADEVLRERGAIELYDGPEDLLRRYEGSPLAR